MADQLLGSQISKKLGAILGDEVGTLTRAVKTSLADSPRASADSAEGPQ